MPEKTDKPAEREERRGTPKGAGTVTPAHGGRIGNPPFEPKEEHRIKVRQLAKVFPIHGEHLIARLIGISRDTLRKYYGDDIELGRAEMLASVGGQIVSRALDIDAADGQGKKIAKGDLDAQKFIMARLGGWTTKVEMGDQGARPFGSGPDLSRLSPEDLELYGRLSAKAEGLDPDEVVGGNSSE